MRRQDDHVQDEQAERAVQLRDHARHEPSPESSRSSWLSDIGEGYGISNASKPLSNGPYRVEDYSPGVGGSMTLVCNENWSEAEDPIRKAYPTAGWSSSASTRSWSTPGCSTPSGEDVYALSREDVQPENLPTVFSDPLTVAPAFEGKAAAQFDPYTSYYWIDVKKVSNVKHRQAISVAMDRTGDPDGGRRRLRRRLCYRRDQAEPRCGLRRYRALHGPVRQADFAGRRPRVRQGAHRGIRRADAGAHLEFRGVRSLPAALRSAPVVPRGGRGSR